MVNSHGLTQGHQQRQVTFYRHLSISMRYLGLPDNNTDLGTNVFISHCITALIIKQSSLNHQQQSVKAISNLNLFILTMLFQLAQGKWNGPQFQKNHTSFPFLNHVSIFESISPLFLLKIGISLLLLRSIFLHPLCVFLNTVCEFNLQNKGSYLLMDMPCYNNTVPIL